ncbi:RNA-binding protein 7 [Ostrinia furnacalis]|uniref:RNA-binding protein 7 n=1 Tax=Ostrinia furnacalis TaxID=93504 RepID=UPI00103951CC|nr:RNA-binding protein 7 [Ostrinia furnacalis]
MVEDDNRTLWCGNLPEQVTEELLYELFLQAGPLEKVRIARDKDGRQKSFAFITFCHEVSVPYAIALFRGTALYHKTLTLQGRGRPSLLPPPIRCQGPDPNIDFSAAQANVVQQFAEMTDRLKEEEFKLSQSPRHDTTDKLVLASLQGNWSHRHHPYRSDKPHGRDDFRSRELHSDNSYKGNSRNRHSNSWRDRKNHKKNYNHRRD